MEDLKQEWSDLIYIFKRSFWLFLEEQIVGSRSVSRETGDEVDTIAQLRDDSGSRGDGEKGANSATVLGWNWQNLLMF